MKTEAEFFPVLPSASLSLLKNFFLHKSFLPQLLQSQLVQLSSKALDACRLVSLSPYSIQALTIRAKYMMSNLGWPQPSTLAYFREMMEGKGNSQLRGLDLCPRDQTIVIADSHNVFLIRGDGKDRHFAISEEILQVKVDGKRSELLAVTTTQSTLLMQVRDNQLATLRTFQPGCIFFQYGPSIIYSKFLSLQLTLFDVFGNQQILSISEPVLDAASCPQTNCLAVRTAHRIQVFTPWNNRFSFALTSSSMGWTGGVLYCFINGQIMVVRKIDGQNKLVLEQYPYLRDRRNMGMQLFQDSKLVPLLNGNLLLLTLDYTHFKLHLYAFNGGSISIDLTETCRRAEFQAQEEGRRWEVVVGSWGSRVEVGVSKGSVRGQLRSLQRVSVQVS